MRGQHRAQWAVLEMWRSYGLAVVGRLWFLGIGILSLAAVLAVLWILDGVLHSGTSEVKP